MFIGNNNSADVGNETYIAIAFFLLESGSEAKRPTIAVKVKGSRFIDDRVQVGKDEDGR